MVAMKKRYVYIVWIEKFHPGPFGSIKTGKELFCICPSKEIADANAIGLIATMQNVRPTVEQWQLSCTKP